MEALKGRYNPWEHYHARADLRRALDMIANGAFSPQQPDLFRPIVSSLLEGGDPYFLLADYASYVECQQRVEQAYRDERSWVQMSIRNTAAMGKFSSDRTIREYADEIWSIRPVSP